jgi:hypothetical protein
MHAASGRLSALRPPLIGAGKKKKEEQKGVMQMKSEEIL